mmetsp:Transcript_29848/g.78570  ORF Transcript_29848/g.78570 Transcript_29848/m.78570 type:complete len:342 (+) Transcript_29848:346-1371(+)
MGVLDVVPEAVLCQEADHGVAEDGRARALQGALPCHDRGTAVVLNDLGQDWQVDAHAAPSRCHAQRDHQHEVVREGLAVVRRRGNHEDEPSHRDPCQDRNLSRDRAAMIPAAPRHAITDASAEQAADGAGDLRRDIDDGGLPSKNAAVQEEQRLVAKGVPRHRAEAALQDEHAEGGHPEVGAQLPELLLESCEAAALGLAVRGGGRPRGLGHQRQRDEAHEHRGDAHDEEGGAPALEAEENVGGDVGADEGAGHVADVHSDAHEAVDLAPVVLRRDVSHDAVGDGSQRRQHGTIESPQNEHPREVVYESQCDSDEALDHAAEDDDGLPPQRATVSEDAPQG